MAINFAAQAGQMADLVSQPVNSLLQAQQNRQVVDQRNTLFQQQQADRQARMQQEQQAQQDAATEAQHQQQARAILAAGRAGNPQARAYALKMLAEKAPPEIGQSMAQADPEQAWPHIEAALAQYLGEKPQEPAKPPQLYSTAQGYLPADQAIGKMPYQAPQRASAASAKATDASGNAIDMSPEGLDLAAETYRSTGKLPTGLFRVPGAVVRVINRASELSAAAGEDAKATMLRQQSFNAQKTALAQVVKQKNMVGAFEKTAQRNMELAHQLSAKVDRSGVPLLNKAIMHFKQNVTGDPDTAAFVNALIAARTEYAKVLSGATGAQGITDSARREAEDLFSKATSPAQLDAVMQTATAEMANRMAAFDDQIAEMQRSSSPTPAPQKPPASTAPQITATDAKGNKVVLINGQWIPLRGN